MKRRTALVAVLVSLIVGLGALPAFAGTPGKWEKVGSDVGGSIWEISAARASDGYLHAVWGLKASASKDAYDHVRISPSGTIGSTTEIARWPTLNDTPQILPDGSGVQVLFSGIHSLVTDPLNYTFSRITAGSSGATWSAPESIDQWASAYASWGIGAVQLSDGTPVVGGAALSTNVYWHVGTNPSDPDSSFTVTNGSLIYFNMAADQTMDEVWAAYYDQGKNNGIWVRRLYPTLSTPKLAPGSVTKAGDSLAPYQQVAMVSGTNGGVYVAYCVGYPTCASARVWKVGTTSTVTIPGTKDVRAIDLSVGPVGRIWAAYVGRDGHVHAARSNKAVTKFGSLGDLGRPKGTSTVYKVDIEGSLGRGDVLINAATTTGVYNIWHTQVLPGLTLSASPTKWSGGSAKTVTFSVRDAGQAVSGATVKVGTRSCKTGAKGTCSIKFPKMKPQKLTATASKSGYRKDALKLTVT